MLDEMKTKSDVYQPYYGVVVHTHTMFIVTKTFW